MSTGFFKQQVNFYISVFFIATFGVLTTIKVLDISHMDNPITGAAAHTTSDIDF